MTPESFKKAIQESLLAFAEGDLTQNCLQLFQKLGYNTDRQAPLDVPDYATFKEFFVSEQPFNEERAKVSDWKHVDLLFQLTKEEVQQQISMFDTGKVDQTIIEAYLFFAIELTGDDYSRTELSQITREVNRLFAMPAMILFKYGSLLTLSVINRRINLKDESKDVLKKVTQIKDISIHAPHRGHFEILFDLSLDELKRKHKVTNFVELHNAWQKTLDTKELNKRFYRELANWYFWAMEHVQFPDDFEKNTEVRNATNLIRLITRVIFIWFIKEKHLVPDLLFDREFIKKNLKEFLSSEKSNNYYNAILQNLFFGTLNQKIEERKFADEGDITVNVKEYGVKNLFRYPGMFMSSKQEVIDIFKEIPFLNGGLFDCLDKTDPNGKVFYGDGFSRNPQKRATIPDFLFFGEEKEVDLNKVFGTKNKRYSTKGLFTLLSGYKFTVTENTPIDEEVALDPELLGKTFENLLASYNPETQTTARKQTGSFYTPREIVNYMVDESLMEYLKQAADDKSDGFEAKIRDLFTYNENENPFAEAETRKLIEGLNQCKILDPACGSGAFPMGILHKMVHVLQKLDPQNLYWRELQEKKAIEETREAYKIGNQEERDKRLKEISDVFENNTSDYGRKLYLIENCIFGVDIQPIAVQISKLRFFISLVIDQKPDRSRQNFGIRSLPNLETKFVAANTLIGLEVPTANLFTDHNPIEDLQNELKATRHAYFNARNRDEKLELQEEDSRLRNAIATMISETLLHKRVSDIIALEKGLEAARSELNQLLQKPEDNEIIENTNLFGESEMSVFNKREDRIKKLKLVIKNIQKKIETLKSSHNQDTITHVARQIASFDPYDQNQSAEWFEPEWMFGEDVKKGFDVVIGNPPYLIISKDDYESKYSRYYDFQEGKPDLYRIFIEKAFSLLRNDGVSSFITPNTFLTIPSAGKIRSYLINQTTIFSIINYDQTVFESASVNSIVYLMQLREADESHAIRIIDLVKNMCIETTEAIMVNQKKSNLNSKCEINIFSDYISDSMFAKVISKSIRLDEIESIKISLGLQPYHNTIHTKDQIERRFLHAGTKVNINYWPELGGRSVKKYHIFPEGIKYLNFSADLYMKPSACFFEGERLILREILSESLIVGITCEKLLFNKSCYIIKSLNQTFCNKYLSTLLNSRLLGFFVRHIGDKAKQTLFPRITMRTIKMLPILPIEQMSKKKLLSFVDQILSAKQSDPHADTTALERRIDELVFKLYDLTYEEVKVIAPDFWLSEEEYENLKLDV